MKNIILIILLFAGFVLNGQTITGDKVITRTQLELAGYKVTGISNDTLMGDNSIMKLVTQYAVKNYVANYVTANSLPSQGGNSGKYLTTNGTVASWNTLPDASSTNEIQTIDTFTVASSLLRLKLSGSAVKTLAMSNFITSPAGSSMQVQYNNAGSFGALDSLTVSANPDRLGIGVPTPTARLDIQGSGATSATNALRIRNSAGTDLMTLRNDGQLQVNTNTEASKSSLLLNGTGFSGGTATTTKPTFLIEPTGATSTGWGTLGTKIGVNAESGFKGNLIDLQVNGSSYMKYNANFPSFALGASTASANYSFASGYLNTSSGAYSSTFGRNNTVNNSNGGAFGAFNTVSGNTSYVFGYDNNITGNYTVGFGLNCLTNINGQFAMSSGGFGGYGDAQTSDIRLFNAITGTASTELFTDGVSAKATLSSNMAWTFTIKLIAITRTVGNGTGTLGDIFSGEYTGTIKNIGGTTALVGSITTVGTNSNTSMSTSAVAITADDTSDNLKITFTPPSTAGSTTVTRVASVVYIQTVAY